MNDSQRMSRRGRGERDRKEGERKLNVVIKVSEFLPSHVSDLNVIATEMLLCAVFVLCVCPALALHFNREPIL